jgi:pyrimidine deaminase RibD-like protein
MKASDFKIHSPHKLDRILTKCAELVLSKQKQDPEYWGMVGACVLDMENRAVYGVNHAMPDGTRKHAERAAIDAYRKRYGDNLKHCIVITTLAPCSAPAEERHGSSCTELINEIGIHKVYCGYKDPHQDDEVHKHKRFHTKCTRNKKLHTLCKQFADTFLEK